MKDLPSKKLLGMAQQGMFGGMSVLTRFILVTFAFLAFAFYQMSGGADFDAQETLLARVDAPVAVETEKLDPVAQAQVAPVIPENVTRVALSLTSVNDVLRPTNLRTRQAKRIQAPETPEAVSEEEPVIILPSLIVDSSAITPVLFGSQAREAEEQAQPVPVPTGGFAVRAVIGNSVNVRGGPGTGYSVVNRLTRGDKVEILQNPGDGWVQLRPVGGGTVGWMAEFLLSEG